MAKLNSESSLRFQGGKTFFALAFDEISFLWCRECPSYAAYESAASEMIFSPAGGAANSCQILAARLQSTIDRSFDDATDKLDASTEDRQGLGSPRDQLTRSLKRR